MEDLFNILSSSARIDKSKRTQKNKRARPLLTFSKQDLDNDDDEDDIIRGGDDNDNENTSDQSDQDSDTDNKQVKARDRTGKRDMSDEKRKQVHWEEIAAFRRSMAIRVANKHDPDLPDPVASFQELSRPTWWKDEQSFQFTWRAIQRNIEQGRWKEPTPIQMQSIPTLLQRRDMIGAAPTGSGKSGAFIIPALLLASAPYEVFYENQMAATSNAHLSSSSKKKKKKKSKSKHKDRGMDSIPTGEGQIRTLLLAPSRELAAQLHREVERLGLGKPGGLSTMLLSKSNAASLISGSAGGKHGLDVLVTTPMRLVDSIEKGLTLNSTRLVVMDEADRLLDATDGHHKGDPKVEDKGSDESSEEEDYDDDDSDGEEEKPRARSGSFGDAAEVHASGSSQTKSFLAQMDTILSSVPASAARGLFSATVTPTVRSLAESILRNPVDLKIAAAGSYGGANTDIEQELMFVGREEGKLLAIRQIVQRGQLKPPAIIFVQSKERAQALFSELLYDGIHVDVIHAGRSRTARDNAVAKFRKGESWVLICTDLVARGVDFLAVNMVINYDLPTSGITYVHRIGRTGRAGRKGKAVTLFTEADFENLRTIANVMKQSGCKVEDWMLQLKKRKASSAPRRAAIDTTPAYDKEKRRKRKLSVQNSKKKKLLKNSEE
jgi:ATP-dependent RNA helicase DDX52/ROK1